MKIIFLGEVDYWLSCAADGMSKADIWAQCEQAKEPVANIITALETVDSEVKLQLIEVALKSAAEAKKYVESAARSLGNLGTARGKYERRSLYVGWVNKPYEVLLTSRKECENVIRWLESLAEINNKVSRVTNV